MKRDSIVRDPAGPSPGPGAGIGLVDPGFWSGRSVLLTGHTCFKGSWLALWLHALGAEVTGLSLDVPTRPALFELARINELVRDLRADVCDRDAIGAVRVEGAGTRVIVNVTSDKCYENREWEWGYREDEAMGGHDPYSSSKGCAELVTTAFRRSFFSAPAGPRLASARAGNVIGGGDWGEDRLVPDIMRAALAGGELRVRSPDSVRPWQHVLNPLSGYLVLAQALWNDPEQANAWNFGPPEEDAQPVGWIVKRV